MFEEIIQYLYERGAMHERNVYDARLFVAHFEAQSAATRSLLLEAIEKYNYETLSQDAHNKSLPKLEFFRGVDDYATTTMIDWGSSTGEDFDITVVQGLSDSSVTVSDAQRIETAAARRAVKMDVQRFPISRLGNFYYSEFDTAFYLSWLAAMWQDIDGNERCGLKVNTIQNNSVACFSLNDFLHDDFSQFIEADTHPNSPRVGPFFPRKLTLVELFQRACQRGYPYNPYHNYWRYFEKEGQFKEIVTWNNATGIREGEISARMRAPVGQTTQHPDAKTAMMYLTEFTNQAIFEGWEEKLRPIGLPEKMHETAFNYGRWSGVNWSGAQTGAGPDIHGFEQRHGFRLPLAYAVFLKLFDGKHDDHTTFYPINDLYTVQVKRFYTLAELEDPAKNLKDSGRFLPIAALENGDTLAIGIAETDTHFGRVAVIRESDQQVDVCDYSFEQSAEYAQGSPVQPEIFAAQENDAAFLKKRLAEGWQPDTKYNYQIAIEEAAEHNAHEALEVLLQAGARLRYPHHRQITWSYDAETMDILDKYGPSPTQ